MKVYPLFSANFDILYFSEFEVIKKDPRVVILLLFKTLIEYKSLSTTSSFIDFSSINSKYAPLLFIINPCDLLINRYTPQLAVGTS